MKVFKKPAKLTPKKRLRAAAQRAAKYAEEDYGSEEPNVRLSRAFVVVVGFDIALAKHTKAIMAPVLPWNTELRGVIGTK